MSYPGPIRVFIGTEPLQYVASEVLKHTILKHCSMGVEFVESWTPADGWHPVMDVFGDLKGGTKFSAFRWMVPHLAFHRGRAIYLDADQVVLHDLAVLWNTLDDDHHLAAVCNATGVFGDKQIEQNHCQTSVMVMNCGRCNWDVADLFKRANSGQDVTVRGAVRSKSPYAAVMQAAFLDRSCIQELAPAWNRHGLLQTDEINGKNYLLHWSHVETQPYRRARRRRFRDRSGPDNPTAWVFESYLWDAVVQGAIKPAAIKAEVELKHLDKHWLTVAKRAQKDLEHAEPQADRPDVGI